MIEVNDLDTVAGLDLSKGGSAARVCLMGRIRLADEKLGLSGDGQLEVAVRFV